MLVDFIDSLSILLFFRDVDFLMVRLDLSAVSTNKNFVNKYQENAEFRFLPKVSYNYEPENKGMFVIRRFF